MVLHRVDYLFAFSSNSKLAVVNTEEKRDILLMNYIIMDARSAMRPCYILPMFFSSFFMPALVGQTAERIFTKLSQVVDIRFYLRTY